MTVINKDQHTYAIVISSSFKKEKTCIVLLSRFSLNLLAFYHEWRSLIDYATHYRPLQLPVHTCDKDMFCWPIKIQSFDSQTSKFTRPLRNALAPLTQTLEGKHSSATRTGILSFVVLKLTMNDRKSIEEFLSEYLA